MTGKGLEQRIRGAAFRVTMAVVVLLGLALLVNALATARTVTYSSHTSSLRILAGDIRQNLDSSVHVLQELSTNPLVWTAISDTVGREAYLRPYLRNLNHAGGTVRHIVLLDYRGRLMSGDSTLITGPQAYPQKVLEAVLRDASPRALLRQDSDLRVLLSFPVRFPYTNEVVGVLLGEVQLGQDLARHAGSLGKDLGFAVKDGDKEIFSSSQDASRHAVVEENIESLIQGGLFRYRVSLFATRSPWPPLLLQTVLVTALAGALLAWGVWVVSGKMAGRLAGRLTRLARAVGVEQPSPAVIPVGEEGDEIDVLAKALRKALGDYERLANELEHLVEERTAALAELEERYRQAFEVNTAIKLIVDPENGAIIDANPAALEFYGYTRQQMLALNISAINCLSSDEVVAEMHRAAAEQRNYFNFRHRLANGEIRDVEVYSGPALAHGKVLLYSVIHDITRRQQAEAKVAELLEEQRAILQSEVFGISVVENGHIKWSNDAHARMLGYEPWEMFGKTARDFYQDDENYRAVSEAARLRISTGKVFRKQVRLLCKDGSVKWFDISGARLHPGGLQSIWGFVDISRQKRVEAELLEAEKAAQEANVAKSRFLATMSHEIRTPMNGILGMAQLLLRPALSEKEREDYARTILSSGQTLLTLLNDILDLSKVEAGRMALESIPFDPVHLVRDMEALFAEQAASKGLELHCEFNGLGEGRRYRGDPTRIRQMLANLVSNAIKFTDRGSIQIEVMTIRPEGKTEVLGFAVTDTGIGVPADKVPLLYQPFSQVDSSITRRFGGTGLGLSIVRSLAHMMNGDVGISSAPGEGSCFFFYIEAERVGDDVPAAMAVAAVADSRQTVRGRVLVVEDNPTNRKVVAAMLGTLGVSVVQVNDGEAGYAAVIGGDRFDLVLMDIQMPVMDGYSATEKIRAWEAEGRRTRIPIIALTADAYEADRQRCVAAGMDDFVPKPVDIDHLALVLRRWMPSAEGENAGVAEPATAEVKPRPGAAFDERGMLDRLGGNRDLARAMIESATADMPGYFDQLGEAVAAGDWKRAERCAHTMKGIAAQLGAEDLARRLRETDALLKAGTPVDAATVAALRHEYAAVDAALQEWLDMAVA